MKTLLIHLLAVLIQFQLCAAAECNGTPVEELGTRKILIHANPATTVEYRSTETNLYVTMTTESEAFLSIGHAQGGTPYMVGNKAVIGTKLSSSKPTGPVRNYDLTSQAAEGIVELPEPEQALTNATFISPFTLPSGATGSFMNFTKPLADGDDVIPSSGEATFIWAIGDDYFLLGHAFYGHTVLTLEPCRLASSSDGDIVEDEEAKRFQQALKAHGIIAALAFGLIMPLAIAASALRKFLDFDLCGKKAWMQLHFFLNLLSFALASTLLGVVFKAKNDVGAKHLSNMHEKIGLTLYILMTLQVISGLIRPSPSPQKGRLHSDVEETSHNETDLESDGKEIVKKSRKRTIWESGHKVLGLVMIALILFTLKSGLDKYEDRYGEQQVLSVIYWVWFVFKLFLLGLVLYRTVTSFI
jgi:hypothetical protein